MVKHSDEMNRSLKSLSQFVIHLKERLDSAKGLTDDFKITFNTSNSQSFDIYSDWIQRGILEKLEALIEEHTFGFDEIIINRDTERKQKRPKEAGTIYKKEVAKAISDYTLNTHGIKKTKNMLLTGKVLCISGIYFFNKDTNDIYNIFAEDFDEAGFLKLGFPHQNKRFAFSGS